LKKIKIGGVKKRDHEKWKNQRAEAKVTQTIFLVAFANGSLSNRIPFAAGERRNRTANLPTGENRRQNRGGGSRRALSPVRSERGKSRIGGDLSDFQNKKREISLQFRLHGGEGGIRTFGTALLR
jgi:hypothetical protein